MKILVLTAFVFSMSAFASGELVNKQTKEKMILECESTDCTSFQVTIKYGLGEEIIKRGISLGRLANKVASLRDETEYFPITNDLIEDVPEAYFFPLFWPVTILLTAADVAYSAGAFAVQGAPSIISIKKLKKDMSKLHEENGEFAIGNKRYNRVKSLLLSL